MTVVAEFTVPAGALPGGSALQEVTGLTVELERIVPSNDHALPFFWVTGEDGAAVDRFLDSARQDPDVEGLDVLERLDGGVLVKATWRPDSSVIDGLASLDATIMNATGSPDGWRFRVRADGRQQLDQFQRVFADSGVPVQLERIYNFAEMPVTGQPLTDQQRETLLVAYREGYFDEPRGTTQSELAGEFGISARAVSTRLRRGVRNLVASTLLEEELTDAVD